MKYILFLTLLFAAQLTHAQGPDLAAPPEILANEFALTEQAYDAATNHTWSLAISNYIQALQLDPTNALLNFSLGHAYVDEGDYPKATLYLNKAIALNPRDPAAYDQRGIAYACQSNYVDAIASFDEALQLSTTNARVFYNRGVVFSAMGNYEAAITNYSRTLQFFPGATLVQFKRANLFAQLGQWQNEIYDYRQILQSKSNNIIALNNLAWTLCTCPNNRVRNGKEAVALATKACELTNWKQWFCIGTLAAAYAEDGQFSNAVKTQQRCITANPPKSQANSLDQRLDLYMASKPYREVDPQSFRIH